MAVDRACLFCLGSERVRCVSPPLQKLLSCVDVALSPRQHVSSHCRAGCLGLSNCVLLAQLGLCFTGSGLEQLIPVCPTCAGTPVTCVFLSSLLSGSVGDGIPVELRSCNYHCDSVVQSTVWSWCERIRMRGCFPSPNSFPLKSDCQFA